MTELKEWDNIPRTMWVWDNDEKDRLKRKYIPVQALCRSRKRTKNK